MASIEKREPDQFRVKIRLKGTSLTETFESREAAGARAAERGAKIPASTVQNMSANSTRQP